MEHVAFYVGSRAVVYWDPDLAAKNLEFLQGIDASYYNYIADCHSGALDGDFKFQAAAALRIAYSQGLEALFALLCALAQAPNCMIGWMQSYKNSELHSLVDAISSGASVRVLPGFRPCTWETMSRVVHQNADCDDAMRQQMISGYGRLWTRFARDYSDERTRQEYNALKHGSRPRMGGFRAWVGPLSEHGGPPAPEDLHAAGGSDYGSTFFVEEHVHGRLHVRPRRVSVNWMPQNLIDGLAAISMSIGNVVAHARHGNGDEDASLQLAVPETASEFDLPWAANPGLLSSSLDTRFGVEHIRPWRKSEVETMLADD